MMESTPSNNFITDFNCIKSEKTDEEGLTETNAICDNLNSEMKIPMEDVNLKKEIQEEKAFDLAIKDNPPQESQQLSNCANQSTEISPNLKEIQNKSDDLKKKRFKCVDCNENFAWPTELKKHSRITHGTYMCNICLKQVAELTNLKNHKRKTHNISYIFICNYCNEVLFSIKKILKHMKTHKKIPTAKGKYSKKTFKTKVEFLNLECIIGKKLFPCDVCRKCFSAETNLNTHKNKYHLKNQKNKREMYKCDVCQKSFKKNYRLMQHKLLHKKLHQCDTCNKEFSKKAHLMAHQLNHSV